jgi:hypothetical protein
MPKKISDDVLQALLSLWGEDTNQSALEELAE